MTITMKCAPLKALSNDATTLIINPTVNMANVASQYATNGAGAALSSASWNILDLSLRLALRWTVFIMTVGTSEAMCAGRLIQCRIKIDVNAFIETWWPSVATTVDISCLEPANIPTENMSDPAPSSHNEQHNACWKKPTVEEG